MNDLAEQAIEHELTFLGVELETKLSGILKRLQDYRDSEDFEHYAKEFAAGEVAENQVFQELSPRKQDSLVSSDADPFGVLTAFARP